MCVLSGFYALSDISEIFNATHPFNVKFILCFNLFNCQDLFNSCLALHEITDCMVQDIVH